VATNRALQDEDPASLDGPALATHLQRVVAHAADVGPLHFEHVGIDIAAGLLVQAADRWGIDVAEVVALLGGASPASAAAGGHVDRIADALVEAGAAPGDLQTLADVRVASPAAAEALDAYLADHGLRLVHGHDLCEPTLVERPDLVLASITARLIRPPATAGVTADLRRADGTDAEADADGTAERAGGPLPGLSAAEAAVERLRRRVPAGERDRFDELLADARVCYQLRDDDGALCFTWPLGLVRRAVRETGARLVAAGVLAAADHLFEATPDEIAALVASAGAHVVAPGGAAGHEVDGTELAARAERRARAALAEPPAQLGVAPDPADGGGPPLPVHVATLAAAREAFFAAASRTGTAAPEDIGSGEGAAGGTILRGLGVGVDAAAGRAFVATGPDQALTGLRPGDVLVTVTTTASYSALFPIVAAVVTETGGLFSHTAILARELELPAVVGVPGLVATVRTGDHVEVDAAAGTVRITRSAPPGPPA
jgi:pyruvate,water dikinase